MSRPQKFYSDYDTGTWCIAMADEAGMIVGPVLVDDLTLGQADAVLALLIDALEPPDWWRCVWCEKTYPYADPPTVLKMHSTVCEKHPANIALAEAAVTIRALVGEGS